MDVQQLAENIGYCVLAAGKLLSYSLFIASLVFGFTAWLFLG